MRLLSFDKKLREGRKTLPKVRNMWKLNSLLEYKFRKVKTSLDMKERRSIHERFHTSTMKLYSYF
jgi:hypothetical protein